MQLRLSTLFADRSGSVDDVLSVGVDTPIERVVEALAMAHGSHVDTGLVVVRRTGARLSAGVRLGEIDVRDGDELAVGCTELPAGWFTYPEPVAAGWRLRVEAGPDAGRYELLGAGTYVIGRGEVCDIVLADTSVSGSHVSLTTSASLPGASTSLTINDLGSANGTVLNGRSINTPVTVADTVVLQLGSNVVSLERHVPGPRVGTGSVRVGTSTDGGMGKVEFNRPMRVPVRPPGGKVELPALPRKKDKRPFQWLMLIAPLGIGFMMYAVTGQAWYLLMTLGMPLMFVGQQVMDRRQNKKDGRGDRATFTTRLQQADSDLTDQNLTATALLRRGFPATAELVARARNGASDLWERRPTDPDFMTLRIGLAKKAAPVTAAVTTSGSTDDYDPEAVRRSETVQARHAHVLHAPVTVSLPETGVIGVSGADTAPVVSSLLLQATLAHSPRDLAIVFIGDTTSSQDFGWTKWLPHTHTLTGDDRLSTVTSGGADAGGVFSVVEQVHAQRQQAASQTMHGASFHPHILLVVAPGAQINAAKFDTIMNQNQTLGISALVWSDHHHLLPGACRATIAVHADHDGTTDGTVTTIDGQTQQVNLDRYHPQDCETVARQIAALVDVTAAGEHGQTPTLVSLVDELGLTTFDADEMLTLWAAGSRLGRSAPIGRTDTGPIELDIRADGPHALIAGTTGSGKSELLQSYIAGLAAKYSPAQINFVLIDYKGGAAFRECEALPHTVGFITDLDNHLTDRALTSLEAELVRRENILNTYAAKDLLSLEKTNPEAAPPVLLIVIDEFAALVKECEAFVDGIMDIAQRGRSLGVHLILATQKPGGVINASIQANTDIRISLRVANQDESNDVIGTPQAAHLPKTTPGRAYLRLGTTTPNLFQSSYANNPHNPTNNDAPHDLVEWILPYQPTLNPPTPPKSPLTNTSQTTDLNLIVNQTQQAFQHSHLPTPHRPWLNPLPNQLTRADTNTQASQTNTTTHPDADHTAGVSKSGSATADAPSGPDGSPPVVVHPTAVIGIADYPTQQSQAPYELDIAELGNLAVYGTSRTGKTTLLRTYAYDLATKYSPADVNVYALDYASRALAPLEQLPHVGAVIRADQTAETDRLFTMIGQWITERTTLLGDTGAANFTELRQTLGSNAPAYKIIIVDGFANFHAAYETTEYGRFIERFARYVADGPTVGIHFILTGNTKRSIPHPISSQISGKLIFAQANDDDYHNFGLERIITNRPVAGRCWDHNQTEIQIATITTNPEGRNQTQAINNLTKRINDPTLTNDGTRKDGADQGNTCDQEAHGTQSGSNDRTTVSATDQEPDNPPGVQAVRLQWQPADTTVGVEQVKLLPEVITASDLVAHPTDPTTMLALGLDTQTHKTVYANTNQKNTILVTGPSGSGRTNTLAHLAERALTNNPEYVLWATPSVAEQLPGFADRIQLLDLAADHENITIALTEGDPKRMVFAIDTIDEFRAVDAEGDFTVLTSELLESARAGSAVTLLSAGSASVLSTYLPWLEDLLATSLPVVLDTDASLLSRARIDPKIARGADLVAGRGFTASRRRPLMIQIPHIIKARPSSEITEKGASDGTL